MGWCCRFGVGFVFVVLRGVGFWFLLVLIGVCVVGLVVLSLCFVYVCAEFCIFSTVCAL